MPRKPDYTEDAIEDLKAIRRWLTQPGAGPAARHRLRAIRAAIARLGDRPLLYAVGEHPGIRELPCEGGYRALYEVIPDKGGSGCGGTVLVLRVFGPGQARDQL